MKLNNEQTDISSDYICDMAIDHIYLCVSDLLIVGGIRDTDVIKDISDIITKKAVGLVSTYIRKNKLDPMLIDKALKEFINGY